MGAWLAEHVIELVGMIGAVGASYVALRADLAALHIRLELLTKDVDNNRDRLDKIMGGSRFRDSR